MAIPKFLGPPISTNSTEGTTGNVSATARVRGDRFEVRHILERSATDTAQAPVVTRSTLKAYPAPARGRQIQLPIVISSSLETPSGEIVGRSASDDLAFLEGLEGNMVSYQEVSTAPQDVLVEDVDFIAREAIQAGGDWELEGLALITIKKFPEE